MGFCQSERFDARRKSSARVHPGDAEESLQDHAGAREEAGTEALLRLLGRQILNRRMHFEIRNAAWHHVGHLFAEPGRGIDADPETDQHLNRALLTSPKIAMSVFAAIEERPATALIFSEVVGEFG